MKAKYNITFVSYMDDEVWPHFLWAVRIEDQLFSYRTGTGHFTPFMRTYGVYNKQPKDSTKVELPKAGWAHIPSIDSVIECLKSDCEAGSLNFYDFCSHFGYSNDSIKALDTYRACLENGIKFNKIADKI